jgi:hypothetical protein
VTGAGRPYRYSPITTRPSGTWPGGRSLAVYICVGVEDYRFGDGLTEDILPGVAAPDFVNTSWRDYGNRVGAFRLFERLARFDMRPTVLLNTDVYDTAPAVVEAARMAGAEFVAHGLTNSDTLEGRTPDDERDYLSRVAAPVRSPLATPFDAAAAGGARLVGDVWCPRCLGVLPARHGRGRRRPTANPIHPAIRTAPSRMRSAAPTSEGVMYRNGGTKTVSLSGA